MSHAAPPSQREDGLYLLVKPSGTKLWQMAYRFNGRQKKLSFGIYGSDDEGRVWKQGQAEVKAVGDRLSAIRLGSGARRGLIDAHREGTRLVGKNINLTDPNVMRLWIGLIVSNQTSNQTIDGGPEDVWNFVGGAMRGNSIVNGKEPVASTVRAERAAIDVVDPEPI